MWIWPATELVQTHLLWKLGGLVAQRPSLLEVSGADDCVSIQRHGRPRALSKKRAHRSN